MKAFNRIFAAVIAGIIVLFAVANGILLREKSDSGRQDRHALVEDAPQGKDEHIIQQHQCGSQKNAFAQQLGRTQGKHHRIDRQCRHHQQ